MDARDGDERAFEGAAYGPAWRLAAAALVATSRASLWLVLALVVLSTDPPVEPPMLFRLIVVLALAPGLGAALVQRALRAAVTVRPDALRIERADRRVDVPLAAVAALVPWLLPLPAPGLWVRLRSGQRLAVGLALRRPDRLLAALAAAGVEAARTAARHPVIVWAAARPPAPRGWARVLKFGVFALAPAGILFNAHQHIAYGAFWGEWLLRGPAAWLRTLAVYLVTTAIYLVLWASLWRGLGEAVALGATAAAPAQAARVRRAVEIACAILYWGGVPVLLALRFLA